jgi:hypothetical protein
LFQQISDFVNLNKSKHILRVWNQTYIGRPIAGCSIKNLALDWPHFPINSKTGFLIHSCHCHGLRADTVITFVIVAAVTVITAMGIAATTVINVRAVAAVIVVIVMVVALSRSSLQRSLFSTRSSMFHGGYPAFKEMLPRADLIANFWHGWAQLASAGLQFGLLREEFHQIFVEQNISGFWKSENMVA